MNIFGKRLTVLLIFNNLSAVLFVFVFCLIVFLYVIVNNFSVKLGRIFLGQTSTKQGLMCLALGQNGVAPVRL